MVHALVEWQGVSKSPRGDRKQHPRSLDASLGTRQHHLARYWQPPVRRTWQLTLITSWWRLAGAPCVPRRGHRRRAAPLQTSSRSTARCRLLAPRSPRSRSSLRGAVARREGARLGASARCIGTARVLQHLGRLVADPSVPVYANRIIKAVRIADCRCARPYPHPSAPRPAAARRQTTRPRMAS